MGRHRLDIGLRVLPLALGLACASGSDGDQDSDDTTNAEIEATITGFETLSNGMMLHLEVPEPGQMDVLCTSVDELVEEQHLWQIDATERALSAPLLGLLADATYSCIITGESGYTSVGFTTPQLPAWVPEMQASTFVSDAVEGSYTLFNSLAFLEDGMSTIDDGVVIVDDTGRVRWTFDLDDATGIDVDVRYLGGGEILVGGSGDDLPPLHVGLDHTVFAELGTGDVYHHHYDLLDDGQILALTMVEESKKDEVWDGFGVTLRDYGVTEPSWSWESLQGVEQGALPMVPGDDEPFHANAIQLVEDDEGRRLALVSLRDVNRVIAIDRDTDEIVWTLGAAGDFSLVDEQGVPLGDDQWFEHQHAIEVTQWPRILMFDNGPYSDARTDGTWTRALELELDFDTMTARRTWAWHEEGWREPIAGDADRLPSGNVLVALPHCEPCNKSNPDGLSAIVEVDPATDQAVWRLDFPSELATLYRAQRIDGCEIFARVGSCSR